jgi:hypothetical protein
MDHFQKQRDTHINRKQFIVNVMILGAGLQVGCANSAKRRGKPGPAEQGPNPQTLTKSRTFTRADSNRYIVFEWDFASWEPDHVHWVAPSNFILYNDGGWFFYARHLAAMRRNNEFFDIGWAYNFDFDVTFKNASGTVIHANSYKFADLNYKSERDNYTQTGTDSTFAKLLDDIQSASGSQWLRGH